MSRQTPAPRCNMRPARKQTPPCPKCDSRQVIPIVYGLPGPALCEEADQGKIRLGGCVIMPDNPAWFCRACEHQFDRRDEVTDLQAGPIRFPEGDK